MDRREQQKQEDINALQREIKPLMWALVQDYAEVVSKLENKSKDEVIARVYSRAAEKMLEKTTFN
ncbi:MAG: hypothetical protein JST83_13845 [Bacteroidetes bacterium]|nr:hypothetical protein [Bacteroidota bacterium]